MTVTESATGSRNKGREGRRGAGRGGMRSRERREGLFVTLLTKVRNCFFFYKTFKREDFFYLV